MKKIVRAFLAFALLVAVFAFGPVSASATSGNLEVIDATIEDKSPTIEVETPTITDGQITSGIKFNQLNDFVIYNIAFKNNRTENVKIIAIGDNNTSEYINLEYDFSNNYITTGETTNALIRISYVRELINQNLNLDDLTISINLEQENGEDEEIIFVPSAGIFAPNTGAPTAESGGLQTDVVSHIISIVLLLVIVGVGIVLIVTRKKFRKTKIGIVLIVFATVLVPFVAFATEKIDFAFKFTNIEIAGRFETFSVMIHEDDESEPITRTVTYGEPVGELPTVEKEGHDFNRWVDDDENEITPETLVTHELNIRAEFVVKNFSFSVTNRDDIDNNCWWGYWCSDDGSYPYGTTIRLKAKSRTGYHITWNDGSTDYEREFPLTRDTVMSFTYAPNHYTVKYDKNADDATGEMADQEFIYDEEQALHSNEFSRTGYTFNGWGHSVYPNGWHIASENWTTKNLTDEDGGTHTFYASWSPIRCRVEYYDIEHDRSYWINSDHFYDEKVPQIPYTPVMDQYDFVGFYADAEYTIPMDYENTILKGDVIVYVKFTPKTQPVNYHTTTVTYPYYAFVEDADNPWETDYDAMDATGTIEYSDEFFNEPSSGNHPELRALSYALALSGYENEADGYPSTSSSPNPKLTNFLEQMGFSDYQSWDTISEEDGHSIGTTIAHKTLTSGRELVAIVPRSYNYMTEWLSNFNVGVADDHAGYAESANLIVERFNDYITNRNLSNYKVWVVGYSRGGGVIDLFAKNINENISNYNLAPEDFYVYTFGAPRASITETKFSNIHDVKDGNDLLLGYFFPESWGFYNTGVYEEVHPADVTISTSMINIADFADSSRAMSILSSNEGMTETVGNMNGREFMDAWTEFVTEHGLTREYFDTKVKAPLSAIMKVYQQRTIDRQSEFTDFIKDTDKGLAGVIAGHALSDLLTGGYGTSMEEALNNFPTYQELVKILRGTAEEADIDDLATRLTNYIGEYNDYKELVDGNPAITEAESTVLKNNLPNLVRALAPIIVADAKYTQETYGENYSLFYTYTLVSNAEKLVYGHIPESIMPILKELIPE